MSRDKHSQLISWLYQCIRTSPESCHLIFFIYIWSFYTTYFLLSYTIKLVVTLSKKLNCEMLLYKVHLLIQIEANCTSSSQNTHIFHKGNNYISCGSELSGWLSNDLMQKIFSNAKLHGMLVRNIFIQVLPTNKRLRQGNIGIYTCKNACWQYFVSVWFIAMLRHPSKASVGNINKYPLVQFCIVQCWCHVSKHDASVRCEMPYPSYCYEA